MCLVSGGLGFHEIVILLLVPHVLFTRYQESTWVVPFRTRRGVCQDIGEKFIT